VRTVQHAPPSPQPSPGGRGGAFRYPGSPLLIRALLRADDRLACCELHPEEYAALRALFGRDRQVGVHQRDGYEAVRALLPPRQTRGLVLIDPPFEATGEFDRLVLALKDGASRFNHGVYAAWYPIKHRSPVTTFHEAVRLTGLRDVVAAEWWWREPVDPATLNGCGLLVRNPPFGFETAAEAILLALSERLSGQGMQVVRLTDE
jgi:23S rRNA (adenine2030-N6)-methyltransferase